MTAALAIFALTYLAVAAGRLPFLSVDRPAAALLGAVPMVAAGALALPALAALIAVAAGSLLSVAGSQLVSNVPFVLLAGQWIPRLADPDLLWLATALAATLAGNLTIIGSVRTSSSSSCGLEGAHRLLALPAGGGAGHRDVPRGRPLPPPRRARPRHRVTTSPLIPGGCAPRNLEGSPPPPPLRRAASFRAGAEIRAPWKP